MIRGRRTLCLRALCLLALLSIGTAAAAQESVLPPAGLPTLYLTLSTRGEGAAAGLQQGVLRAALQEWWQAHCAGRIRLVDLPAEGGAARPVVEIAIRRDGSGYKIQAKFSNEEGRQTDGGTRVFSPSLQALVPAVAGEILGIWARGQGYPPAQLPPPRLAGLLELSDLAVLDGGPEPASEALDCAMGPGGPVVLFGGRTLSLGRRFEMTPATARDLALRGGLQRDRPAGGVPPDHLAVDPWGEPIAYGDGVVIRYEPEAADAQRVDMPVLGAQDFTGLAGGGFAVLAPGGLWLWARQGGRLTSTEIPLPSPFHVTLGSDPGGALWLYDLADRRIRILAGLAAGSDGSAAGGGAAGIGVAGAADPEASGLRDLVELRSVRPLVDPRILPLPQLLRVFPDGGFLLGGAGELWRFDAAGWPLWRLEEFRAGIRQSLPAFYRIAVDDERSFYLLDPLARRILRFVDLEDGPSLPGTTGPRFSSPPEPEDLELAGLFRRWSDAATTGAALERSSPQPVLRELVDACVARDLLLMARSLSRMGAASGSPELLAELDAAIRVRQAGGYEQLGRRYEEELLLPGAEAGYNAALRVLRALRTADPVAPEYPERIRELEGRRNAVRDILVQEPALQLLPPVPVDRVPGAGSAFALPLRNLTGMPLQELRFQVRIPGLSAETRFAEVARFAPRGTATLYAALPPGVAAGPVGEDLQTRVLILVTATAGSQEQTFWLEAPLTVPAVPR